MFRFSPDFRRARRRVLALGVEPGFGVRVVADQGVDEPGCGLRIVVGEPRDALVEGSTLVGDV